MLSFVVYSYFQAFIVDDDDVVAVVAQGQLVLTYFAALAIFSSDVADQNREDQRNAFSSRALGFVLVAVFFASSAVAICLILLDTFGYASLREAYVQAKASIRRSMSRNKIQDDDDSSSGDEDRMSPSTTTTTQEDDEHALPETVEEAAAPPSDDECYEDANATSNPSPNHEDDPHDRAAPSRSAKGLDAPQRIIELESI